MERPCRRRSGISEIPVFVLVLCRCGVFFLNRSERIVDGRWPTDY